MWNFPFGHDNFAADFHNLVIFTYNSAPAAKVRWSRRVSSGVTAKIIKFELLEESMKANKKGIAFTLEEHKDIMQSELKASAFCSPLNIPAWIF